MGFNKSMLPANVTENDDVVYDDKVNRPIALVIKNPPQLLETTPTSPSGSAEDVKEISANEFPRLRGFT